MIQLSSPLPNQVYQRNAQGRAYMTLVGNAPADALSVEVALKPGKAGQAFTRSIPVVRGTFTAELLLEQGDYSLSVAPVLAAGKDASQAVNQAVGVGEVFVVWGHSVAQGDSRFSLGGATDGRVFCVAIQPGSAADVKYNATASQDDLPTAIVPYATAIVPGPYGSSTHFWAKFCELITLKYNVPTMLLNAAYGGTNLDQWAKSVQGTYFEHSFVNARLGQPYKNLANAFKKYTSESGYRAMLVDHGVNDWTNPDYDALFADYKLIIAQARNDSQSLNAAVVVCRNTPFGKTGIRTMQERVIAEVPYCFAGPDYDKFTADDHIDDVHLNVAGQAKAAEAWAGVFTSDVLARMDPYHPNPVPVTVTPVTPPTKVDSDPLTLSAAERLRQMASSVDRGLVGLALLVALLFGAFWLGRWSARKTIA